MPAAASKGRSCEIGIAARIAFKGRRNRERCVAKKMMHRIHGVGIL